jgi:hypothetical protein
MIKGKNAMTNKIKIMKNGQILGDIYFWKTES